MYTNNNPYFNGYTSYPYGYQTQMQRQGQMANMPMQQQTYDVPFREVKFVTSQEAIPYIVMPNSSSLLIDKQNGIAYVKTADTMGQSTTKTYKFEEVSDKGQETAQKDTKEQNSIDLSQYIKKDEISGLGLATKQEFDDFTTKIENIVKNVMSAIPKKAPNTSDK